jgi:hypothetical protein
MNEDGQRTPVDRLKRMRPWSWEDAGGDEHKLEAGGRQREMDVGRAGILPLDRHICGHLSSRKASLLA